MFERYSYKKKLIGLSIVVALLLLTANKKSFKVTKQAYGQLKEAKEQLEFMRMSGQDSQTLQEQIKLYDGLIGKQDIEPSVAQQSILDFATQYEDVIIDELKETHFSSMDGFEVITNQLILEGSYQALTRAVYDYEKKFNISSLVSIDFYKEKNFAKRTSELKVLLIFQNYEKSN